MEMIIHSDGTCVRDYTHINDVARAFLSYCILDVRPKKKVLHLTLVTMNPISLKGLVGAVENALDITMDVEVSPVEKATW